MREVTNAPALEIVELNTFEFDAEVAGGPGLTAFDSAVKPEAPWICAPSPTVPRSPRTRRARRSRSPGLTAASGTRSHRDRSRWSVTLADWLARPTWELTARYHPVKSADATGGTAPPAAKPDAESK